MSITYLCFPLFPPQVTVTLAAIATGALQNGYRISNPSLYPSSIGNTAFVGHFRARPPVLRESSFDGHSFGSRGSNGINNNAAFQFQTVESHNGRNNGQQVASTFIPSTVTNSFPIQHVQNDISINRDSTRHSHRNRVRNRQDSEVQSSVGLRPEIILLQQNENIRDSVSDESIVNGFNSPHITFAGNGQNHQESISQGSIIRLQNNGAFSSIESEENDRNHRNFNFDGSDVTEQNIRGFGSRGINRNILNNPRFTPIGSLSNERISGEIISSSLIDNTLNRAIVQNDRRFLPSGQIENDQSHVSLMSGGLVNGRFVLSDPFQGRATGQFASTGSHGLVENSGEIIPIQLSQNLNTHEQFISANIHSSEIQNTNEVFSDEVQQMTCLEGEVLNVDGSCVEPIINKQIYVYAAPPAQKIRSIPPSILPRPKVNYNIVFVRTPEQTGSVKPIVIPPPQMKTLVYVLNRRPDDLEREIIDFPINPTKPEVYFVNYADGENPQLPGGIDLNLALTHSEQQGQIIDSALLNDDESIEFDNDTGITTGPNDNNLETGIIGGVNGFENSPNVDNSNDLSDRYNNIGGYSSIYANSEFSNGVRNNIIGEFSNSGGFIDNNGVVYGNTDGIGNDGVVYGNTDGIGNGGGFISQSGNNGLITTFSSNVGGNIGTDFHREFNPAVNNNPYERRFASLTSGLNSYNNLPAVDGHNNYASRASYLLP